jgi:hypothetical protein
VGMRKKENLGDHQKQILQGSSEINRADTSMSLFRVEAKLNIQPFDQQKDSRKLNNWLRQCQQQQRKVLVSVMN